MAIQITLNTPQEDNTGANVSALYVEVEVLFPPDERTVSVQCNYYRTQADAEAGKNQIRLPWPGDSDTEYTGTKGIPAQLTNITDTLSASEYSGAGGLDPGDIQNILPGLFEDGQNNANWGTIVSLAAIQWDGLKADDPLNEAVVALK